MIVVGVDGSESSIEALRWALAEARLRGTAVRAVHTWSLATAVAAPGFVPQVNTELLAGVRDAATALLDDAVHRATGEKPDDVDVERSVVEGRAAAVLVDAARDAELLVVGSRGLGGFRGLLLGSVSHQCAHHAPCPVVIVRARDEAQETAESG